MLKVEWHGVQNVWAVTEDGEVVDTFDAIMDAHLFVAARQGDEGSVAVCDICGESDDHQHPEEWADVIEGPWSAQSEEVDADE